MAKSIKGSQPTKQEKIKIAGEKAAFREKVKQQSRMDSDDTSGKTGYDHNRYVKQMSGRGKTTQENARNVGPNRRVSPKRLSTPRAAETRNVKKIGKY